MNKTFSESTKKMVELLPYWFKIKKDPSNSIGAQFLEVFGFQLDELGKLLDYAYEQTKIQTADQQVTDITYKTVIKENVAKELSDYDVLGSNRNLSRVYNIGDFIIRPYDKLQYPEMNPDDVYFFDDENYTLYVKQPHGKTKEHPEGVVILRKGVETINLKLSMHMLWNYFDEFGFLINLKRLHGETNREFKERILDVFKNPANSTRDGLFNGISRELGLRVNREWTTNEDFEIKEPMVVVNKIQVDDEYVNPERIVLTSKNTVIVKDDGSKKPQRISYISGIEMHSLNNKEDFTLMRQLYMANGTASRLLEKYADTIRALVPIMWNQFTFNESYWDVADSSVSGFGALPHITDAKIGNLIWYDPENPSNSKKPNLLEIISNDITVFLNDGQTKEISKRVMNLMSQISIHPEEINVNRGDLIEFDYSYGKNG